MPTRMRCPSCSTVLMLPDTVAPGSAVRCPKCQTVLRLPGASVPARPPTAAKPAAPAPPRPAPPAKGAPQTVKPAAKRPAPPSARPQAIKQPRSKSPPVRRDDVELASDDEASAPARSKSKKGLLIGCGAAAGVLLLVCGGASFGVYRLFQKGTETIKQGLEELARIQPEKPKFEATFIHADCNGAIVIHPSRIAKARSPLLPPPDKQEEMLGAANNPLGFDFRKIDELVVVLEPAPPGKPRPPHPQPPPKRPPRPGDPRNKPPSEEEPVLAGFIIRCAELDDGKAVLDKILNGSDAIQAGNQTIYKSRTEKMNGQAMTGAVAGDRTILVAPEPMLRKMIAAKDVHSPLTDRLRELEPDVDLFGLFLAAPMKPALKEMVSSPQVQQQFPSARNLDEDLVAIQLVANLEGDKLLQITLEGKDAAAAKNLEEFVEGLLAFAKVAYPQFRPLIENGVPPEVGANLLKVADQVTKKEGITVTKEGNKVSVTLNKPQGL